MLTMKATVDNGHATVDPFQDPDHHRDVHPPRRICSRNQAGDSEVRDRGESDGVDLVPVGFSA